MPFLLIPSLFKSVDYLIRVRYTYLKICVETSARTEFHVAFSGKVARKLPFYLFRVPFSEILATRRIIPARVGPAESCPRGPNHQRDHTHGIPTTVESHTRESSRQQNPVREIPATNEIPPALEATQLVSRRTILAPLPLPQEIAQRYGNEDERYPLAGAEGTEESSVRIAPQEFVEESQNAI